ncbi:MAG: phosphotransferase [Chloroflexi bacterium]|nr:phosphotransferase [Chloroflexota bacterium]
MKTASDFYDATPDEQVRRLAGLAEVALPQWGLEGAEVTQVAYRENMTFRIDAGDRGVFALRIHAGNYRSDAQIQSELDLMTYLDSEGVRTPSVVPTRDGALFTTVSADGVTEPRQCDLFKWIDGKPLRMTGQPIGEIAPLAEAYTEVGRIGARIYNATERWQRPAGFDRPAWDAAGIYGVDGNLGDFRRLEAATDAQMRLMLDVSDGLTDVLADFGQSPDRYGLAHGDFLAENIFVCGDGIRLLDFDDAGDSWYLFDIATALFDLLGTPAYEPCFDAIVSGYREHRDLPDEHLAMLPAFFLARLLSYLGWCANKPHMPQTAVIAPLLLAAVEQQAPALLAR